MSAPEHLRAAIASDLKPVRPLPRPVHRSLILWPIAAAIVVGVPLVESFRPDILSAGLARTWLLSVVQAAAGLVLVALALRESVPGRALTTRAFAAAIMLAIVLPPVVLALTARGLSIGSPPGRWWAEAIACFRISALAAAPVLLVSALLAARAFPLRPAVAGALYGLGSGLIADAGLRLYCDYTMTAHVLFAHGGAIASTMIAGIVLATGLERRR